MGYKNTMRVWLHSTHQISKDGLFGSEESIRIGLLDEYGKHYLKFDKLSGLQKKVIRKLGLDKERFKQVKQHNRVGK